jgi:cytochrome c biogenesis protein CcmG, thiol:disulfide interchange protein DsbE
MVRPLALIPPLVFAAFLGAVGWQIYAGDGDELPSALIGQAAPGLPETGLAPLPGFDGAMLASGGVTLVNFWASWCAPCRVEHPHLTALAAEGVTVYGVNYKDDPANAMDFLDELGNPYAGVLADGDGRRALDWGVYGVPETFVIAGDGTVIARMAGPVTERTLRDRLRPALAEAAAQ